MPLVIFVMLFKVAFEAIRGFREKAGEARAEPLCVGCLHAHVQYAASARRAISCCYGGAVRPMKLDVLYCTDYQARGVSARPRVIGFVREIRPAEEDWGSHLAKVDRLLRLRTSLRGRQLSRRAPKLTFK